MTREFLKNIKSENRLDKIRLIMKNDDVIGGQPSDNENEFTSNTPLLDLACTMKYAVDEIEKNKTGADTDISAIKKSLNTKAEKSEVETALQLKANTSTNINAGDGLTGGGDLTTSRTLTLGTPSTISQNTKNSVTDSSHTHEITKATTAQQGIVQLTNTIDTSQDKATTPSSVKSYVDAQIEAIPEVDLSHLVEKDQITNELGNSTELVASQALVNSVDSKIKPNTASKNQNGWWKCGDTGIIQQWGVSRSDQETIFPISFPNACSSVVLTHGIGTGASGAVILSKNKNSFEVKLGDAARSFHWIATGY